MILFVDFLQLFVASAAFCNKKLKTIQLGQQNYEYEVCQFIVAKTVRGYPTSF